MDKDVLRIESLQDPDEQRMVINEVLVSKLGAVGARGWWSEPNAQLAGHIPGEIWHHDSNDLKQAIANAARKAGEIALVE
jgi:hypothetical protein